MATQAQIRDAKTRTIRLRLQPNAPEQAFRVAKVRGEFVWLRNETNGDVFRANATISGQILSGQI